MVPTKAAARGAIPAARRWKGKYSADLLQTIDLCMRLELLERPQSVFALQRKLSHPQTALPGTTGILDSLRRTLGALLSK